MRNKLDRIWRWGLIISFSLYGFIVRDISLAASLAEIKERGKLIVGVKDNLRPLGFVDSNGQLQGLEIDIARNLAKELLGDPNAVVLVSVSNQERLKVVLEDKVDITIARVTVNSARSRVVNFSNYYYLDGTGIIVKNKTATAKKIVDRYQLRSSKIAVLNNSSTIAVIYSQIPNVQLIGVNSYREALELLENDTVEAFAADRSLLAGWVQEYPEYRLLDDRLSGEALAVVMPKGLDYQELYLKINESIDLWRQNGWLQERIKYWQLPE
jgi:polar amino acid transport system substrate-binding protein